MTRQITPIVKSIVDQILELPVDSVVLIEFERAGSTRRTVLHRTGENGWLATRDLLLSADRPMDMAGYPYFNADQIRRILSPAEDSLPGSARKGLVVTLLHEGFRE